ncbi:FAS1 domain-containing protein [Obelidium mucronatum]|nr:FAS1 domain-containing protein [Obelidium mucronatum]
MKFTIAFAALVAVAQAATLVEVLTSAGANTLIALVKSDAPVLTALSTFKGTLFAPTDAALAATVKAGFNASDLTALTQVLTYHAAPTVFTGKDFTGTAFLTTLQGNEVKAATNKENKIQISSAFGTPAANVVKSLEFDGGVVHVVDQTLIPPANVVSVAKAAGLTSLVDTIVAAGLAETVAGLKDVTILAPTNEAFAAIASVAKTLTVDQLKQVLLLHVVPGIVHSTDIVKAKTLNKVATANKDATLNISFDGTNVLASGPANTAAAKVAVADVLADKVIVHVIDTVLLPKFETNIKYSSGVSVVAGAAALVAAALMA